MKRKFYRVIVITLILAINIFSVSAINLMPTNGSDGPVITPPLKISNVLLP